MKKIKLTQGKFALVDNEDFEYLNQWKWHFVYDGYNGYAYRNVHKINNKRTSITMHRVLMKAKKGQIIDHINHNGLDNRKANLRYCNLSQNAANRKHNKRGTSKYLGVHYRKKENKWIAAIKHNGKSIHIAYCPTEREAALLYNKAAIKYHGQFANLNQL